jgi:hypothetical protein
MATAANGGREGDRFWPPAFSSLCTKRSDRPFQRLQTASADFEERSMNDDPNIRAQTAKKGSPFLNSEQAAHFLGMTGRYLRKLRALGKGPVWRRHARVVQYHVDDLTAWSETRSKGGQS